jgi:uncharacterized cupin superfamily protein
VAVGVVETMTTTSKSTTMAMLRATMTIGKGDFATFPAGMRCTWDIAKAVEKHYMFFRAGIRL